MSENGIVGVIGATSGIGSRLVARLRARGRSVVAIGRSAERLASQPAPRRVVDLTNRHALVTALADARFVVSCAPIGFARAVLDALPDHAERIVLTGSTRRFTKFPDKKAEDLAIAEAALHQSGRTGVILHPTMICGGDQENNVQRIAAYIRRFGIVPLPQGGLRLIQPIYVDDVAACLEAALYRAEALGPPLIVAGPEPVTYRDLVKAVARAIEHPVRIVPVPASLLIGAANMTRFVPGLPRIETAEIRRLLEDKAFDISDMRRRLAVEPISLAAMLAQIFPASQRNAGSHSSKRSMA
jgi:nucleoside-diphosphate-sugar epimerase